MPNNSYIKFINFFKEHKLYDEEIFTYLRENSIMFDYLDTDQRPLVGTYYTFDKRQMLNKIILYIYQRWNNNRHKYSWVHSWITSLQ